jgi:hypothetical protein
MENIGFKLSDLLRDILPKIIVGVKDGIASMGQFANHRIDVGRDFVRHV